MVAPEIWLIIKRAMEKVIPCVLKSQQQRESEAAIKRAMDRARRELQP